MWCSIMSHTEKIKSEMIENLDGKKKKKKILHTCYSQELITIYSGVSKKMLMDQFEKSMNKNMES